MRARTGLWEPRVGNGPGPPGPKRLRSRSESDLALREPTIDSQIDIARFDIRRLNGPLKWAQAKAPSLGMAASLGRSVTPIIYLPSVGADRPREREWRCSSCI